MNIPEFSLSFAVGIPNWSVVCSVTAQPHLNMLGELGRGCTGLACSYDLLCLLSKSCLKFFGVQSITE